ncbi:MAG: hypothetical protein P1S60_01625, partial [Anaerolineae bacterium]|nr:hypothetical protein [Anaerolineae bacterium]
AVDTEKNLEDAIEQQADDGSWQPNWSWGNLYPETCERARIAWSGVLTVQNLRHLSNFHRIENVSIPSSRLE